MPQLFGGPLDGGFVENTEPGLCVHLGNDRFACYFRQPWDDFMFVFDGNYHFHEVVTGDDLVEAKHDS